MIMAIHMDNPIFFNIEYPIKDRTIIVIIVLSDIFLYINTRAIILIISNSNSFEFFII